MKKLFLTTVLASTLAMANSSVLDNEFKIAPSVAVIGGSMDTLNVDNTDAAGFYGLAVGFNCLLSDTIRQELQITNYDNDDLKILQVNLNPRYLVDLTESTTLGMGPTFGLAKVENLNDSDTVFTYGLGVNLQMNFDNAFVAAETKYELTQDAELANIKQDVDNLKVLLKVGYTF